MNKLKTNPYRLVPQIAIIALLIYAGIRTLISNQYVADFEAYCPFGGIQAYASFLFNNSLACNMTNVQISMGLFLVIAVVVFSKLFCSVICPVGSISEWLGKLCDKWKVRRTISGLSDKILRSLKYVLLFITFYVSVTTSELFCKWFCPYFSITSGFNPDIDIIMATIALVIVIVGSIFFRLFWCKYLCPINAISNIFRFFYLFAGITVAYFLIRFLGMELSFIWPLAILCVLAYIFELRSLKNKTFPLFKITRDEFSCTSCQLCAKSCPQAIPVASLDVVRDADCHLCGDCIQVCPEKGALTINRRGKKWLPVLAVIVLIIAGLLFSRSFELPTVYEQWASKEDMQEMEEYSIKGLKTITCYGSSIVFASHMYDMEGIYGGATFMKDQRANIWYDSEITDTIEIQKWIFSPSAIPIRDLPDSNAQIAYYSLRVDNFLDPLDGECLAEILAADSNILGITTEFACPVKVSVYFSHDSELSPERLKNLVEQRDDKSTSKDDKAQIKYNFRVIEMDGEPRTMKGTEYLQKMRIED